MRLQAEDHWHRNMICITPSPIQVRLQSELPSQSSSCASSLAIRVIASGSLRLSTVTIPTGGINVNVNELQLQVRSLDFKFSNTTRDPEGMLLSHNGAEGPGSVVPSLRTGTGTSESALSPTRSRPWCSSCSMVYIETGVSDWVGSGQRPNLNPS